MAEKIYHFTDPEKPAKTLIVMLKINIALFIIAFFGGIFEYLVLSGIKKRAFVSEESMMETANLCDGISTLLSCIQILFALVILVVFLRWMYRAAANNHASGIENISQKPHWGWINFIIPVWSLFKPYEFFREVWNAVDYDKNDPGLWKKLPAPKCLTVFWSCFIVSNILGRALSRLEEKLSVDGLIYLNYSYQFLRVIDVVENIALIMLISGIMIRQLQYRQKISGEHSENTTPQDDENLATEQA